MAAKEFTADGHLLQTAAPGANFPKELVLRARLPVDELGRPDSNWAAVERDALQVVRAARMAAQDAWPELKAARALSKAVPGESQELRAEPASSMGRRASTSHDHGFPILEVSAGKRCRFDPHRRCSDPSQHDRPSAVLHPVAWLKEQVCPGFRLFYRDCCWPETGKAGRKQAGLSQAGLHRASDVAEFQACIPAGNRGAGNRPEDSRGACSNGADSRGDSNRRIRFRI
jgi:hypothetical protein